MARAKTGRVGLNLSASLSLNPSPFDQSLDSISFDARGQGRNFNLVRAIPWNPFRPAVTCEMEFCVPASLARSANLRQFRLRPLGEEVGRKCDQDLLAKPYQLGQIVIFGRLHRETAKPVLISMHWQSPSLSPCILVTSAPSGIFPAG